jgi:hypothetical protein
MNLDNNMIGPHVPFFILLTNMVGVVFFFEPSEILFHFVDKIACAELEYINEKHL